MVNKWTGKLITLILPLCWLHFVFLLPVSLLTLTEPTDFIWDLVYYETVCSVFCFNTWFWFSLFGRRNNYVRNSKWKWKKMECQTFCFQITIVPYKFAEIGIQLRLFLNQIKICSKTLRIKQFKDSFDKTGVYVHNVLLLAVLSPSTLFDELRDTAYRLVSNRHNVFVPRRV